MTVRTHNANGYKNGCRCETCRAAFREHHVAYLHRTGRRRPRAEYLAALAEAHPIRHGTENAYTNRRCRCDDCREAARVARARRRERTAA